MIHGIGVDTVIVGRIRDAVKRHGARFAARILMPEEILEWERSPRPDGFLARRFAAKEAFAKAVGTGIRGTVSFRRMRVIHDPLGRPSLWTDPPLTAYLQERGIAHTHLSVSDETDHAVAFVILERA